MRLPRAAALAALLAGPGAFAAMCEGPCSLTINFANGGAITTTNGAELTFGAGGELVLGAGGSITLGTSGSITPNVDPPDMSAGGTLSLGPGGFVTFGTGGSLDSGTAGGAAPLESSNLVVTDASSVSIDSAQSVHLGSLDSDDQIDIFAGGAITQNVPGTPISFDTTGPISIRSDANVTYDTATAPTLTLEDGDGATGPGNTFCTSNCGDGTTSTLGSPNIPVESNTFTSANTGALGLSLLLPLVLLGFLRRR